MPPKITLDTNCVIGLFDRQAETPTSLDELQNLLRYGLSNKIEVAITTRVEADLSRDKNPERKKEILQLLNMLPVVGTVARWDVTRWDAGDVWGSDETDKLWSELQKMVFPGLTDGDKRYVNKRTDIDHLLGHLINRRDIFVTDDKDLLRKHEALKASQGLLIMSPARAVEYVDRLEDDRRPKNIEPRSPKRGYQATAHSGKVIFDYSDNNGVFAIGEGIALFETKWSKASDVRIHAYNGAPSIAGIALAKAAKEICDITNAASLDYSSANRTANEGQIVVWRNTNGLYAATKVVDVKDDSRPSDDRDEITFEYLICADTSGSFVK